MQYAPLQYNLYLLCVKYDLLLTIIRPNPIQTTLSDLYTNYYMNNVIVLVVLISLLSIFTVRVSIKRKTKLNRNVSQ